jgi:hypothetical protein
MLLLWHALAVSDAVADFDWSKLLFELLVSLLFGEA